MLEYSYQTWPITQEQNKTKQNNEQFSQFERLVNMIKILKLRYFLRLKTIRKVFQVNRKVIILLGWQEKGSKNFGLKKNLLESSHVLRYVACNTCCLNTKFS